MHYFRCNADADNLSVPKVGDDLKDPIVKDWSTDLTKLRLGYTQFGFQYDEGDIHYIV